MHPDRLIQIENVLRCEFSLPQEPAYLAQTQSHLCQGGGEGGGGGSPVMQIEKL
jgi:hypothetical protein